MDTFARLAIDRGVCLNVSSPETPAPQSPRRSSRAELVLKILLGGVVAALVGKEWVTPADPAIAGKLHDVTVALDEAIVEGIERSPESQDPHPVAAPLNALSVLAETSPEAADGAARYLLASLEPLQRSLETAPAGSAFVLRGVIEGLLRFPMTAVAAPLDGFVFAREDLSGSRLTNCRLRSDWARADFHEGGVVSSNFDGAPATGMDWRYVDASDSTWVGAWMIRSSFQRCRFDRADFTGAHLGRTTWTNTSVAGADFASASLLKARFNDVDLRRAENLTWDQLVFASWNLETSFLLPDCVPEEYRGRPRSIQDVKDALARARAAAQAAADADAR